MRNLGFALVEFVRSEAWYRVLHYGPESRRKFSNIHVKAADWIDTECDAGRAPHPVGWAVARG